MIKLSLVAAVAVAGLTTTASASAMEDAIKNTDLSGYIRYRYTNGKTASESNEYKTVFKVKSKVNDNVSAFIKAAGANATTNASGDADPDQTAIKEAKFVINAGGATIIAGKQGLQTPFAALADQQGTGVVALYPVSKALTLAAGWYTNTDASALGADLGGNNITAVAAIGSAASVNYALWYASISENDLGTNNATLAGTTAGASAINLNVSAKVGPVSVALNHAEVDFSSNAAAINDTTTKQTRLVVSGQAGPATVTVGYVATGKDGGDVTLGDTDATANFDLETVSARDTKDANIWYIGATAKVAAATVGLEYVKTSDIDGTVAGDVEAKEAKLSVAYAMSKNFKISAFITDSKVGTAEMDFSRIEMKYTF